MKIHVNNTTKVVLSLLLASAIMWWMYRGTAWEDVQRAVNTEMRWKWMVLSMPFGILAQVFRATRWQQMLQAMGKRVRLSTCVNAIFLSYASSLAVPRIGEFLRCGTLKRWEGIPFSEGVGTVVSERVLDMAIILLLTLITVATQIPVFSDFMAQTGMSLTSMIGGFTTMGYVVTAVCGVVAIATLWLLARRLQLTQHASRVAKGMLTGMLSVRGVRHPGIFVFYSLGIWVAYFLHFYLTFYCFDYTENLGPLPALVAFMVGCFAVLVPTPNGAGSWHFAVKTVLVLYGVAGSQGAMFVLIVHTLQTLLVVVLGLLAMGWLAFTKKRN
ncbi:MAG: lysylphosphatidylglycerol synthase transmembrane domain-containing protein [Bacteroidaceae bacterium]|nr:lysylphosphatidylglycerol synthase transmembrane domain-containing protein [Bacteroidaceae bacterium]